MNTQELVELQNEADRIERALEQEVGSSTMDMINRLIEIEILLEKECNK